MPEHYRAKGQQCLKMASEATDSVAATLLRMLADDYFDLAEKEAAPARGADRRRPTAIVVPGPTMHTTTTPTTIGIQ